MQPQTITFIAIMVGLIGLLASLLGDLIAVDHADLPDDLRAAKGIVSGGVISLAIWCILGDVILLLA